MPPRRNRILIVDFDPLLLPLREARLREAGFQVTSAGSSTAAERMFDRSPYELVILSHTISFVEREFLAQRLKQERPLIPILVLCAGDNEGDAWADSFANGLAGSDAMVRGVKESLRLPPAMRMRAHA